MAELTNWMLVFLRVSAMLSVFRSAVNDTCPTGVTAAALELSEKEVAPLVTVSVWVELVLGAKLASPA